MATTETGVNPKELRVGNVISFCTHPVIIWGITQRTIFFTYPGKSERLEREVNNEFFAGIVLTPAILEKCGFEPRQSPNINGYTNGFFIYYPKPNDCAIYRVKPDHYICDVKYLHELQNLTFCLLGTELKYTP